VLFVYFTIALQGTARAGYTNRLCRPNARASRSKGASSKLRYA